MENCLNLGGLGAGIIKSGDPQINVQKKFDSFVEGGKQSQFILEGWQAVSKSGGPRKIILESGDPKKFFEVLRRNEGQYLKFYGERIQSS